MGCGTSSTSPKESQKAASQGQNSVISLAEQPQNESSQVRPLQRAADSQVQEEQNNESSCLSILSSVEGNLINSLKRYRKESIISTSQNSRLFQGVDTLTGRQVAIKFVKLPGKLRGFRSNLSALKSEVTFLKSTEHENVVSYLDYDVWESSCEIVMELCEGKNLGQELRDSTLYFDEEKTANSLRQILSGLSFIHENRNVHGSLKWENIHYDTDTNSLKLSDQWSLKQHLLRLHMKKSDGHDVLFRQNIDQTIEPNWIAPEVLHHHTPTTASDVWSVGCIAIEMLSGLPPFQASDRDETIEHIKRNAIPRFPQRISKECKQFLKSCFNIDPNLRSTVKELLESPFIQRIQLANENVQFQSPQTSQVSHIQQQPSQQLQPQASQRQQSQKSAQQPQQFQQQTRQQQQQPQPQLEESVHILPNQNLIVSKSRQTPNQALSSNTEESERNPTRNRSPRQSELLDPSTSENSRIFSNNNQRQQVAVGPPAQRVREEPVQVFEQVQARNSPQRPLQGVPPAAAAAAAEEESSQPISRTSPSNNSMITPLHSQSSRMREQPKEQFSPSSRDRTPEQQRVTSPAQQQQRQVQQPTPQVRQQQQQLQQQQRTPVQQQSPPTQASLQIEQPQQQQQANPIQQQQMQQRVPRKIQTSDSGQALEKRSRRKSNMQIKILVIKDSQNELFGDDFIEEGAFIETVSDKTSAQYMKLAKEKRHSNNRSLRVTSQTSRNDRNNPTGSISRLATNPR